MSRLLCLTTMGRIGDVHTMRRMGLRMQPWRSYGASSKLQLPKYDELNGVYDQTIANLAIHKGTRVICQGFTGKQVCVTLKDL